MCDSVHDTGYSQVSLRSGDDCGKLAVILTADLLDGDYSCHLLVDNSAEASLAFDDDVWDTHFAAESREVYDEFNRVNIMRDNYECRLLGLNQSDHMVETIFRINGFFCLLQESSTLI